MSGHIYGTSWRMGRLGELRLNASELFKLPVNFGISMLSATGGPRPGFCRTSMAAASELASELPPIGARGGVSGSGNLKFKLDLKPEL